jgi:ATP-dependent DNA helicase RecQ
MRYLREQLDDPEAVDCGRCDNCGGLQLSTSASAASVEAAVERLARPGVAIEPRRMWPTGLAARGLALKGRITGAEEGRAVARLTDLGYGQQLRELFRSPAAPAASGTASAAAAEATAGPPHPASPEAVPVPLVRAVIELLGDWHPTVDVIVYVESETRPALTRDLAEGLSRYLQRPVVGTWALVDRSVPPGAGAANSAQRVAAVSRRSALRADVPPGARVLLVDDLVVTGWSLTLAASALREAGAGAVLPLALATQS